MTAIKCTRGALAAFTCFALLPAAALAQSSITGEVSDTPGASCRASPWKLPARR